jgi:hypothetical protein
MEQLEKEGRLIHTDFPKDWEKYRFSHVVHEPRGVEEETIYRGDNFIKKNIYSFPAYPYRLLKSFISLNRFNFYVVMKLNQAGKKSWQNSQYYLKYSHTL